MEALAYEESPLSEYLESRGTGPAPSATTESNTAICSFAPGGLSKLRKQLRDVRRRATRIAKTADDAFLEHFRYLIIASQLLEEPSRPRPLQVDLQTPPVDDISLFGALCSAICSFAVVWTLNSLQSSLVHNRAWSTTGATLIICASTVLLVGLLGRRRCATHLQQRSTKALSRLAQESHAFDSTFASALRLVQEVEVISRGYEISHPLPPITRIESQAPGAKCVKLRQESKNALRSLIGDFVDAHNLIHQYTSEGDLTQYHGIYDVSLPEVLRAVALLNEQASDQVIPLRDLRFLYETLIMARKVFLCDLLALPAPEFWGQFSHCSQLASLMADLVSTTTSASRCVQQSLDLEESKDWGLEKIQEVNDREVYGQHGTIEDLPRTPEREQLQTQLRRLEGLANGIRALNARMHVFREEADVVLKQKRDSTMLSSVLMNQHELVGAELRNLLTEWEQGKRSMLLGVSRFSRGSRASSGLRSPVSPSPSLGGLTMVDDGPSEALRVLNGDDAPRKLSDLAATSDEEVFEAVSISQKRASIAAMSREERIVKLQADRKKRATMQESADRTTSMLRELEMVIKHRPRGRTTSRMTAV